MPVSLKADNVKKNGPKVAVLPALLETAGAIPGCMRENP